MIILFGILIFLPYNMEGAPFSILLTIIILGIATFNILSSVHDSLQDMQNEQNNQEVVNSDNLKCEPSANGDWICKKIKPVATFDANSKLFIKNSSNNEVKNNSSEEEQVILKERPLPKDNSISLKCTVTDDGTYICNK